jgi:HD-GYP domain-containing protein (c-di-GMP phosphodiesterase class II)
VGQDIHPMARIVAITDTYDAMTTKRTYNEPMRPIEALKMMKEKISGRFDPDLLNAMHSILFKMKFD